jgi:UDP-2-acetamido-3-amino-2,3-dideoxy-glucuronate N-acetyltransferase
VNYNYIEKLKRFKDSRGDLLPLNFSNLPFTPKRIFMVTQVPKNVKRGDHAHYTTKQLLVCLKGVIEVELFDGVRSFESTLEEGDSLYVPEMVWDSQVFKTGEDILMVLASTDYDPSDYITDMGKFKGIVSG